MSRPDRQRFLDRIDRCVRGLQGSEFSEEQLHWAALVTAHNGWPLRDAIVLREARRRAEMESDRARDVWEAACGLIRAAVPHSTFELWVRPVQVVGEDDGTLILAAPTAVLSWAERRYLSLFNEAVRKASDDFTGARFAAVALPIPMREVYAQAAEAA